LFPLSVLCNAAPEHNKLYTVYTLRNNGDLAALLETTGKTK
jgi:hypothetical protein